MDVNNAERPHGQGDYGRQHACSNALTLRHTNHAEDWRWGLAGTGIGTWGVPGRAHTDDTHMSRSDAVLVALVLPIWAGILTVYVGPTYLPPLPMWTRVVLALAGGLIIAT